MKKKQKNQAVAGKHILRQPVAESPLPEGYAELLQGLKERIRTARVKAAFAVNREMIALYMDIGSEILKRQKGRKWGSAVVTKLSADLKREFPDMKGLSTRNLWDMRRFAEEYHAHGKLRQLVAEIPWGHNLLLLNSIKDPAEREWYIRNTIKNGWSRTVLSFQIGSKLYKRQGRLSHNFTLTLPEPQSDLAIQTLKDPYVFDFLTIRQHADEKDIEDQLMNNITRFLLELGAGFAFVGRQYKVEAGNEDFYIDLLFYHVKLRCYVVVELKAGDFRPEYAGKLNFYLSAIDSSLRGPDDKATIGLVLCKSKNKIVAEYALRGMTQPIGVAEYRLVRAVPENLRSRLPSIEEIEKELAVR